MTIEFLDPSHEEHSRSFALAPRLDSLNDSVVAIVSNGKKGTLPFFDAFAEILKNQYKVAEVVRITKFNFSTPVDSVLLNDAARWQALVAGVGD